MTRTAAVLGITGAAAIGVSYVVVGPLWLTGAGLGLAAAGLGLFWLRDHALRDNRL